MKTKYTTLVLSITLFLYATAVSFAQTTLYSENFTNQENKGAYGSTIDLSDVDWTIDVSDAILSNNYDWFKVRDGRMEGHDLDGEAIWYSPSINISNYLVSFSLVAREYGSQEPEDYLITEYRLNNSGNWIEASNNGDLYDDFGSLNVTQTDISGTLLEIRVRMKNSDWREYHNIDDVTITGVETCALPQIFNLTGDDLSICSGSSQTTAIGLDGSESGVTYQLFRDGSDVGAAISGSGLGSTLDFGDFNTAGTYTVEATRTDGGCTQTMAGNVVITNTGAPTASFTASATIVDTTQAITFTNSSSNATSYTWDFGDGSSTSILENPTHTFTAAGTFTVTLTATNSCGSDTATEDITVYAAGTCSAVGTILMEKYDGISGNAISDLTGSANYPENPSSDAQLTSFEISTDTDDNYGVRVNGYICAPQTGYYTFWIASDNNGQLNLSTDDDPANKTTIATVDSWTGSQEWDRYDSQKSDPIQLIMGESYYVEALMKEGGGGDNLAVGWAKPGESTVAPSQIIPGSVLSPAESNYVAPEDLFYEDFEGETEGDISGTDDVNNINWSSNEGSSTDRLEVRNGNYFEAKDTDAVVSWFTDPITITNYNNLNLSLDLTTDKLDNSGDYINIKYKLDGGNAQTLLTQTDDYDGALTADLSSLSGNTLEIIIEFKNDKDDEYHRIDNVRLTGTIDCDAVDNNVTNASATADDIQATLSWSNPSATCFSIDQVLVVAKQGSAVTTSPSGDGSDYTASATFGFGNAFDGGFVVYKGGAETVTITGLVNFVTYHATLFTRSGTTWSSGETILVTPSVSENLFYEDFSTEQNNSTSGTDLYGTTWGSDDSPGNPGYFGVYDDSDFIDAVFWAEDTDGLVYWYTDNINIQGYENLNLRSFVEFYEIDNDGDFIKFYYKLDGGDLQEIETFTGDYTDTYYDWNLTGVTGDNLQIWVEFNSDDNNDYHGIGNIKLTGSPFYNVWQGAQDDLVTTNSNWSKESVPTATSNVLVPSTKHLTLEDDREFNAIKVESSANLTIEKTGSLTTIGDFTKIAGTGTITLNSDSNEFASIIVEGTATGDITYNKYVNGVGVGQWDLVGSPVTTQSISDFVNTNDGPLAVDPTGPTYYAIGTHDAVTDSWTNYTGPNGDNSVDGAGNFTPAKGYQMATDYGATMAFTGEIATTTQSISIKQQTVMWNLVANPFPSYIKGNGGPGSTDNFLNLNLNAGTINTGNFGAIYAWKADNSGYQAYNNTNDDIYIAPGQGFFVAANSTSPRNLIFTPQMRTTAGGDDFIDGAPILLNYNFDLKLFHGNSEKAETKYFFKEGLTLGLDPGYDAGALDQLTPLSSRLPETDTGVNFQINAMSLESAYNQTIPLVINQQEGQSFRISISNNTLPEDINVYLEDVLNGTLTPLKAQDFELSAQEDLSDDGRFYLHFTTQSLAIDEVLNPNNINVYKLNTEAYITINGLTPEIGKTTATLYNMLGMKVRQKALDNSQDTQHISTQGLAGGVYIIELKAGDIKFSKKVIIQ